MPRKGTIRKATAREAHAAQGGVAQLHVWSGGFNAFPAWLQTQPSHVMHTPRRSTGCGNCCRSLRGKVPTVPTHSRSPLADSRLPQPVATPQLTTLPRMSTIIAIGLTGQNRRSVREELPAFRSRGRSDEIFGIGREVAVSGRGSQPAALDRDRPRESLPDSAAAMTTVHPTHPEVIRGTWPDDDPAPGEPARCQRQDR